jgi:uracil phosphoribosyltransferase
VGRIVELKHPLVSHHLKTLRDKSTSPALFRAQIRRLSLLLGCEATSDLPLMDCEIETPLGKAPCRKLACRLGLVPILRAGLGMCEPLQDLMPESEVWHVGFYRDETSHQPIEYYRKFTRSPPPIAFVLDPMLATGGSACEGISMLKRWGVQTISLLCIVAAPEGIEKVSKEHANVDIFCCAIDVCLNENAYIVPGLGDAGDRIFNTC